MAFSFLLKGAASVKMAEQQKVQSELAVSQQGKPWRFYLKKGEKALITFVDGDLNESGILAPSRFYEHHLHLNGKWGNFFVCPQQTLPALKDVCPICLSGDKPTLVALFTIIDHRIQKSADGTKTYQDMKRLLPVKPNSFDLLHHHAVKRGGLAGARFEAMRVGEKDPAIGSQFDFEEKLPIAQLQAKYMIDVIDPKTNTKTSISNFTPINYDEILEYRTGEQLQALGLGKPQAAPAVGSPTVPGKMPDYSGQL